jgi:UDP-glucose 4-epimerase
VREVIGAVEAISGRSEKALNRPRRAGDPAALVACAAAARQTLGWEPRFKDLESIVRTAWNWHTSVGKRAFSAIA